MSKQPKTLPSCSCGKGFDCARCGRHVWCDPDANLHPLKICRRCCVKEGIQAIYAAKAALTTAALTAPRELAIRQTPRIGMAERGVTEEILMDAWAGGRLADDVYEARMTAAAKAVSQAELDILTIDIAPAEPGRLAPRGGRILALGSRIPSLWLLILFLILLAISVTGKR